MKNIGRNYKKVSNSKEKLIYTIQDEKKVSKNKINVKPDLSL